MPSYCWHYSNFGGRQWGQIVAGQAVGQLRLLIAVNYRARGSETYAPRMRRQRRRAEAAEVLQTDGGSSAGGLGSPEVVHERAWIILSYTKLPSVVTLGGAYDWAITWRAQSASRDGAEPHIQTFTEHLWIIIVQYLYSVLKSRKGYRGAGDGSPRAYWAGSAAQKIWRHFALTTCWTNSHGGKARRKSL